MDAIPGVRPVPAAGPEALPADGGLADLGRQPTRLVDLLLGTLVLLPWAPGGFPAFLSVGLAALAVLLLLASTRRPERSLGSLAWLPGASVALLGYLVLVSVSSPDLSLSGWPKRALRIALVLVFLLALLQGRIHLPSVVRGMALGLVGNAALFVAGVAPNTYDGYLSGFLLDKNQAGLAYAVVGLLLCGLQTSRGRQALVLVATLGLVWETGSRTSLAALACGTAWFALRPRLGVGGRLLLGAGLALAVDVVESSFARVGVFADRDGSDAFRARIDAAARAKLATSPPQGSGLGEAYVDLPPRTYFFHNSYWTALLEGGWVLVGAYVLVTVVLGVGLLRSTPTPGPWASAAEAANVAVLVCALRLGEVFGTTVAVTALAAGLLAHLAARAGGPALRGAAPPPAPT